MSVITNIKVICGYPASGKTTYVEKHKSNNDLIYDYDKIMHAISGLEFWESNIHLQQYILDFYLSIIKKCRYEKDLETIWIIKSIPDKQTVHLLSKSNNKVDFFMLDTTKEVCEKRIKTDERRKRKEDNFKLLSVIEKAISNGDFDICKITH